MPALDQDTVVLVTGCSSGFGRDIALAFARRGCRVYASMRNSALPERRAFIAEAAASGYRVQALELDVDDDASVATAAQTVLVETRGRLDVLVNNAGYFALGSVEETTTAEWRAQLETNVVGVARVARAFLPAMRERGRGTIINLGSISGHVVLPLVGVYHASKFAVRALSEAMRLELAPFGIQVVLIEPGSYATRLHDNERVAVGTARPDSPYAPLLAAYRRAFRWIRRADPEEVVELVVRAAEEGAPRFRRPVGPTSFLGTVGRSLAPDALYQWMVGIAFRWRGR